jgi:TolB protein
MFKKDDLMKHFFAFLILFISQSVFAQYAYIKIGDAQAKKSNLAFPVMNQMNASKSGVHVKLAAQIHNTALKDLELSTYFNIMSPEAFLEDTTTSSIKAKSLDANGFKFDTWKTIGAEFLIRSSFSLIGDDISVEMYLYHINEAKAIVGKKYSAKSSNTFQIGHTLANDVLEALTGRRGVFLSKITASTNRTGHKEIITMNWDGSDPQIITKDKNIAIAKLNNV